MEFGPKRGHVLYIFENFVKDFSLLIIALIIGLIQGDMGVITENIGVLVIVLFGPVTRIIQYLTTYYSVDNQKLTVRSGVFKKNVLEIPLSTITTVDFSQNVLHQIFGAYRLNVDNASNVSGTNTKVNMTFSTEDAEKVRDLLIQGRDGLDGFNLATVDPNPLSTQRDKAFDSEKKETATDFSESDANPAASRRQIKIKSADLLLLGLLKSKGTFFIELIALLSAAVGMLNVSDTLLAEVIVEFVRSLGVGMAALSWLIAIFLLSMVCGMIGTWIRYYGFEIMDNGQALKIEYGFFTKKRYTIQKNRVSGFLYQQSFLMRLMGTGTLQLFAIGYGRGEDEQTSEEPIIFPLIKTVRLHKAMAEILPEMMETSEYSRPCAGSLRYFFYGFGFAFALLFLIASIYLSVIDLPYCHQLWVLGLFSVAYSICGRIQEYKNAAIYSNFGNISLSCGGFKKRTVFVKSTHVESVTVSGSRWKQKKGIGNVEIGYIAPLSMAKQSAKNVPVESFDAVREKLIY